MPYFYKAKTSIMNTKKDKSASAAKLLLFLIIILFADKKIIAQTTYNKSFSLTIDTIKLNVKDFQDSTTIKNYLDFVFDNFRSNIGNTVNICTYLYNRGKTLNNEPLMASALNIKASIYALSYDYSNATKYYLQAAEKFEKINVPYSSAMMYNNLGMMYNNTNNKKAALNYFKKGLDIAESNKIILPKAKILINLANLYITVGNLNLGLEYALKADTICNKLNLITDQAINANLIGAINFFNKDYEKALFYYKSSLDLSIKSKDKHSENTALSNMGEVYALQKNKQALEVLKSPEIFFSGIKDYVNLQQVYTHYASYYGNAKDYDNLIAYNNKLREVDALLYDSTQRKSIIDLQTKYETQQKENKIQLLSKADSIKTLQIVNQQFAINKNLYLLAQQNLALSNTRLQLAEDSLKIATQNQTIIQNQLDSSLSQEKINKLTKESLQKQLILQQQEANLRQKNNTILITIITAIALLLLGYGFYRRKQLIQKANLATEQAMQREQLTKAIIDAEEAERKRIAADLHDGIGQLFSAVKMNLNGLIDRIEIPKQEDKFLAEKTLALVDESCKEVRVISHKMMPNFLLKSGIASDIRSFIEKIDEQTLKVNFETRGFKDQLEFDEEVILYRVIQELINNVIKHAQASELKILLERNNSEIIVQVIDNGKGFNYQQAKEKEGLGIKNILVRVEYLKGKIDFKSANPKGTHVTINIPIS